MKSWESTQRLNNSTPTQMHAAARRRDGQRQRQWQRQRQRQQQQRRQLATGTCSALRCTWPQQRAESRECGWAESRAQRPERRGQSIARAQGAVIGAQRAERCQRRSKWEQSAGSKQGEQANKVSESGAQAASKVSKRMLLWWVCAWQINRCVGFDLHQPVWLALSLSAWWNSARLRAA